MSVIDQTTGSVRRNASIYNTQIFGCPSTSSRSIVSGSNPSSITHSDWPAGINYAMNQHLNRVPRVEIKRPSALLIDSNRNDFRLITGNHYLSSWGWDRHTDGWNAALADGSAN
ncbi:MAG: hypothetical protein ACLFU7_01455 [Armatimonadota bacterium]|jgi:hypothetical protein